MVLSNMNDLEARIAAVARRIAAAVDAAGREPGSVALLAVTKAKPVALVAAAHDAGIQRFGVNYLQEGAAQMDAVPDAEWHFIGRLQSNKTRAIAERFAWVHSLDREAHAKRLAAQRPPSLGPLNVLIQVDVDGEPGKGGVAPEAVPALATAVAQEPMLCLRGVMVIPRPVAGFDAQRRPFATARAVFERLRAEHPSVDTLSMGMSDDVEAAIHEGSTLVRIGTALFGARA